MKAPSLLFLAALCANVASADEIQTGKGHRFACTDYTAGKVFIVSAQGKVEWEYDTKGHCNELWVLPNGNLLFNTGHAIKEINRDKEEVFSYESPSEIYASQRLPNGNTFIGECSAGRLLEVSPSAKIVKELKLLPEGKDGGHLFMRNARQLKNGNYLVCLYNDQVVKEFDPKGNVVLTIPAASGPHSAVRLPNGHTLIATGDLTKVPRVFEVDEKGVLVWEIKNGDLPNVPLLFMTAFQRLPNGNTVMSNWVGHKHFGEGPHLIEVTADKKVVWSFFDHKTMKTISSVQLLDVPGDAIQGDILH